MRNDALLTSDLNKTFEEVLWMTEDQFRQWCIDLRKLVVDLWDNHDLPPRVGFTKQETIEQFRKMIGFPVNDFEMTDLLTGENNVIRNTSVIGNAVNDWFPTMMKTKITYTTKEKAKSIYDYFANDELLETFITYATRHFKRDSFYHYSTPISVGDHIKIGSHVHIVKDAKSFVRWFETTVRDKYDWDYWYCGVKTDKEYTGYNQKLKEKNNITVTAKTLAEIPIHKEEGKVFLINGLMPLKPRVNMDLNKWDTYSIRLFQKGQKLFPKGLKAFRISFCQYAVNFPPLTAKYLYEKYLPTDKYNSSCVPFRIYDPSMGWGGRLLGAMAVETERHIIYIGTDPNTDHTLPDDNTKYDEIGKFFNDNVRKGTLYPSMQEYQIFQLGSEEIKDDEEFQKHKGFIDLVFTSPPYFAKEIYSDDDTQSCNKFNKYLDWKEGFLRPTLETCVEWMKPNRYLLWNISDAQFAGEMLPLEEDSKEILLSLGMKYIETLKMTLAQMPGGNRFVETGETEETTTNTIFGKETKIQQKVVGKMKNYCKIRNKGKEILLKYEPIMVFLKP